MTRETKLALSGLLLMAGLGTMAFGERLIPPSRAAWSLRSPNSHARATTARALPSPSSMGIEPRAATDSKETKPPTLPEVIAREVAASTSPDDDPAASARRLDRESAALTKEEGRKLRDLALDARADGDSRAVAVELLARALRQDVLEDLGAVATAPLPPTKILSLATFERALRARAIEGLARHPEASAETFLRQAASTEDPFLSDRGERALLARAGLVPSPEVQDERALRQLLDRGP